jgi:hypothetical protein
MLPALMDKGEYGYNVDDVSGYFHVPLTERSQEFFGFEWEGVYYVYTALNFGWKSALYVYTCFSGEVAGFLRRLGLRYLFLLDDALGTAVSRPGTRKRQPGQFASAGAVAFIVVSLKVALGYFVHAPHEVGAHPEDNLGMAEPVGRFQRGYLLGTIGEGRPDLRTVVEGLGGAGSVLYDVGILGGEVGSTNVGGPWHSYQVTEVLQGVGRSPQVSLYGPAGGGPLERRATGAGLHAVLAGGCGAYLGSGRCT